MSAPAFDLQSHSTRSDGSLEPAEVVARAAAAGVRLLALSDHDTVDGLDEALAAAQEHGLRLVTATELSCLDGDREDLHVLGYGIDHHDPALLDALERWRADRAARGDRMADALEQEGFALDRAPLEARRAAGLPVGRPHLAQAAFDHPGNAERCRREGLADFGQLLGTYLVPGARAFRRRTTPTVAEAIGVIHDAGGVAVWAHPFWDLDHDAEVIDTIDRFVAVGLDGVEAFYITHTREQTLLLAGLCAERGLLSTGSADFHGPDHPRFHAFRAFDRCGAEPDLGPLGPV
ncbi:PHP domain-containing protein [Baekduia soli]|uniref:PHP domain-containing protein n=1 Tax=Baekduia soli TaxID=496014 RepID=A0A5B8TZM5_9ACTN|nr:PHP domain-containing protein [Baekduia soli]QEC46178.1 PHP domain-containing protein [Baekduia soli]